MSKTLHRHQADFAEHQVTLDGEPVDDVWFAAEGPAEGGWQEQGVIQQVTEAGRKSLRGHVEIRSAAETGSFSPAVDALNSEVLGGAEQSYQEFLTAKLIQTPAVGFEVSGELNPHLFDWQREVTRWALRRGRAALFLDCGLGKTLIQLVWAQHVAEHTGRPVLILAPLAVARQTQGEGAKFGIPVTVCREQADVQPGVNVTNYDLLKKFDPSAFGGVVPDESSILKAYMGATKRLILESFAETPYRLACTATPAPNDHLELGNHAEFLGVMPSNEMIMRWFINDTMGAGKYRLKGHAEADFWRWVSNWAISLATPADLGYSDAGYVLPELDVQEHFVEVDLTHGADGALFRMPKPSATQLAREKKLTARDRAVRAAALVHAAPGAWVLWCNTDAEADELRRMIPEAVEVRGSDKLALKEERLAAFARGEIRVLITKPSICAFGMNWQHCHQMAFVGVDYSFEAPYQAIRRCWRFGQRHPVSVHIILAETEASVRQTVIRKAKGHEKMKVAMRAAAAENGLAVAAEPRRIRADVETDRAQGDGWELHLGDSCQTIRELATDSVRFSIYSPPFSNLYIYSDSIADMGNAKDDAEFLEHYRFLVQELHRVTLPGRLTAVHCKDLPLYKGRDGAAGLRDFPGQIVQLHEECGWTYHSRVTIWKDPVIEMQRTKNHGLLYCNVQKNSAGSRQGMADYLVVFRKWTDVEAWPEPIAHTPEEFPLDQWQQWASPVWMDIDQTNVLNYQLAREGQDEKHICPLQLDVIHRAVKLWSNPGDLVLSPFAGIGSEGFEALRCGRKFVGIELKRAYWNVARRNLESAAYQAAQPNLLDLMAEEGVPA